MFLVLMPAGEIGMPHLFGRLIDVSGPCRLGCMHARLQNPVIPGMIQKQAGKRVVWSSALLMSGRTQGLLRQLGLLRSSAVSLRYDAIQDSQVSMSCSSVM